MLQFYLRAAKFLEYHSQSQVDVKLAQDSLKEFLIGVGTSLSSAVHSRSTDNMIRPPEVRIFLLN